MAQETMDTTAAESSYPVQYSVEYPESSSRLKALFRLILIIPIAVIYILVSGINGALFPALVFMLLFRKKYPRWWFAVNLEVERFTARVWGVPLPPARRVPLHRRTAGCPTGHRIPRCPKRSEPVATAHQVAASAAPLDHHWDPFVRLPDRLGDFLDCDNHHRKAPARPLRLYRRLRPVGNQSDGLRDPSHNRPVSALPLWGVGGAYKQRRLDRFAERSWLASHVDRDTSTCVRQLC